MKAGSGTGRRASFKERYSLYVNKNPRRAVLVMILFLNLVLFLTGALVISALAPASLKHRGFWPSVYYTVSMILDPGNMALVVEDLSDAGVAVIIACIAIIILGMIIFTGAIIGYVTNYISNFIEAADAGDRKLEISGHTIILNWNSRASEIVNDMLYSDEAEKVVVMVQSGREAVEQEIRDRISDTLQREKETLEREARKKGFGRMDVNDFVARYRTRNRLTVIVREGDTYSIQKLNDISIKKAKAVILLGQQDKSGACPAGIRDESEGKGNSSLLKTLIQVAELTGLEDSWDNQKVIVEVEDPWTMQLVSRVIEHKESHGKSYIVPVSVDHILGQILSQFSIMPELNMVYDELFSNKGAAFYSEPTDYDKSNQSYIEAYFPEHRDAVPLTSFTGKSGKQFYYMAWEASAISKTRKAPADHGPITVRLNKNFWLEKRNIIILGHNSKIHSIIDGFNAFRGEWNFRDPELIEHYRTSEILDIEIIDTKEHLEQFNYFAELPYVRYAVAADIYDREIITDAINQYIDHHEGDTSILVLSDDTDPREDQDAAVMTYLIYLRDIVRMRKEKNPDFDPESIDVIYEILDPKNYDIIRSYSAENVIISNRYISKMVTQISEKEEMYEFYNDILTYDQEDSDVYTSKELYVKKAHRFFEEIPGPCTAAQLIRAVYEAAPDDNKTVVLGYVSPGAKMVLFDGWQDETRVELTERDKLIVFTKH